MGGTPSSGRDWARGRLAAKGCPCKRVSVRRLAISLAIIASALPSLWITTSAAGAACTDTLRITDDGTREDSWSGVSATSSTDAWAVGDVFGSHGGNHEIIGHWDGRAWRHSRPPDIRNQVELRAVEAHALLVFQLCTCLDAEHGVVRTVIVVVDVVNVV